MATVNFYQAGYMPTTTLWSGKIYVYIEPYQIAIVNGYKTGVYTGFFNYTEDGELIYGAVSGYSYSENNQTKYSISGLSADALTIEYYFNNNLGDALQSYLLQSNDSIFGSVYNDTLLGYEGNDFIAGDTGNDHLSGDNGDDTLSGGTGIDTLIGGLGNDLYLVDDAADIIDETNTWAGEFDTVESSVTWALGANIEKLVLTGTAIINGIGNALDNTLVGNAVDNILTGDLGADTLIGGLGNDTLFGGLGNDTYRVDSLADVIDETSSLAGEIDTVESSVTWTLGANLEKLVLTGANASNGIGNALNNTLVGNGAANILTGGLGADTLTGGLGNDTYRVDNLADVIRESSSLASELDTVESSVTWTLGANLEKLVLTGTNASNGIGNALNNTLVGNGAANILTGGLGADTLTGGLGNDTYRVDNLADVIRESSTLAGEIDTVESSVTWGLGANLEKLVLTGTNASNGIGNALNNTLVGNGAANILTGGLGADTLTGGLGNDLYKVDNLADVIRETSTLAGEIDTVESSVTWGLGANLEKLVLTGTNASNGIGNALNNTLVGNGAANILTGGLGADTLTGGLGNDLYKVDNLADVIRESSTLAGEIDTVESSVTWGLGANLEKLVLTGTAAINGSGNALNNTLVGNAAANILTGGLGADTLTGGLGNDTYRVDNLADVIRESSSLAGEFDTVESSVTWGLGANLEKLVLTGTNASNGSGNALNNTLVGNAAANILTGGLGADTLTGGLGDDTYRVDNLADVIRESSTLAGEIDTVESSVTWGLGANLEKLVLTGTNASNGIGNALNNTLVGNGAANILTGGLGADTLTGGLGDDTYRVDNLADVIRESSTLAGEFDTVESSVTWALGANLEKLVLTGTATIDGRGNALNNSLFGNAAANNLQGGSGNDFIVGGLGVDTLVGGSGADRFDFNTLAEMGLGNALRDIVNDFKTSEGDRIDLSTLDANDLIAGNQSFTLVGTLSGAGQLHFNTTTHILSGSTDADTSAEFEISLLGVSSFGNADFIA